MSLDGVTSGCKNSFLASCAVGREGQGKDPPAKEEKPQTRNVTVLSFPPYTLNGNGSGSGYLLLSRCSRAT